MLDREHGERPIDHNDLTDMFDSDWVDADDLPTFLPDKDYEVTRIAATTFHSSESLLRAVLVNIATTVAWYLQSFCWRASRRKIREMMYNAR